MEKPEPQVQRAREARAWRLRSRGWSQYRIADELRMSQGGVSRLLQRIERRELKRMSRSVESIKVTQNAQLEHIVGESLDAWDRSKTPRKRAARKTAGSGDGDGDGATVETSEVVERDGDCSYLYAAMNAMGAQRSLWGLDVAPALQEPAASVASLAADCLARGLAYEQRKEPQASPAGDPAGAGRADPVGAAEVPRGPLPVQRDHPLPESVLEPPGGDLP